MLQTSSFLKPFYYQLPYCICTFILLYYSTVLWFSRDLGMQLSSTAYAAQRQFQCQCGTVFSFLPFHDQAASLLPSHLCSASCSLWLAVLSTTQLASLVLRLPGLAALSTALLQFLCRMEFKWRCQQSSGCLAEYQHKIYVLCHSGWKIIICFGNVPEVPSLCVFGILTIT